MKIVPIRKNMYAIKFSETKNGQERAYYFSDVKKRWLPMPMSQASMHLNNGLAFLVR